MVRCGHAHLEAAVVEAPIRAVLEEVRVAVGVGQGAVQTVGQALPVGHVLRVRRLDRRLLRRIEAPVLGTLRTEPSFCLRFFSCLFNQFNNSDAP